MEIAYIYGLLAALCLAIASQVYAYISRVITAFGTNFWKSFICVIAFLLIAGIGMGFQTTSTNAALVFILSGIIGLGIGDIFLLKSFSDLGPGRTLILFSFQPVIIGILSYLFLNQGIDTRKLLAVFCFIFCVFIFSFENYKKEKQWKPQLVLIAIIGIFLDCTGLLISRYGFDIHHDINVWEATCLRFIGAMGALFIIQFFIPSFNSLKVLKALSKKHIIIFVIGTIIGTVLGLTFAMLAIRTAHLASLSGIFISGAVFASLFECIIAKKLPSKYFTLALISFFIGAYILLS